MSDAPSLAAFSAALAARGLGLTGTVSPQALSFVVPGVATIVLCGSGGRAHWDAIPPAERASQHPIAEHAQRAIAAALPLLGGPARFATPAEMARIDLRALAERAGWGVVSPHLRLLIHPTYGPWVSIRAVVLAARALPLSQPLRDFDPCGPCARPCLDTCPAGAYRRGRDFGFLRCAAHRVQEPAPVDHCDDKCRARSACVVGTEHAYAPAEMRHRHRSGLEDIRRWFATQRPDA